MQPQQQMQLQQHQGHLPLGAQPPALPNVVIAPQWLKPPAYESTVLKDLVANHFPAIVPTHLYEAQDYKRHPSNNFRGAVEIKATFEFPLHRVDETNDLGFVLVVEDLWPDLQVSWFDVAKDKGS